MAIFKVLKVEKHNTMSSNRRTSIDKSGLDGGTTTIESKETRVDTFDLPLQYTPIDEIEPGVKKVRGGFFNTKKTHSLQYRLNQLRNLYFAIKENEDAICEALDKDFHRSKSETKNLELIIALNELLFVMSNLHRWIKPEAVDGLPTAMVNCPVVVERIPLGVVLIIAPFNYPLNISLSSIVAAIAGGNTVVFKPSENTANFSRLFCDIVSNALDDDIFFPVNGAVPETTKLLEQKFDKIMYTGSTAIGKIINMKAAETLTPVLLELGGKSPCFVLEDISDDYLEVTARRIAWGRFTNAGQTCVAVDYVLVHESIKEKLVNELVKAVKKFYPEINSKSNYTHLIHDRAFERIAGLLENTKGDIVIGGETDSASRFIAPTIIDNCSWDDAAMQDEIFGPLLPIISYRDLETAVEGVVSSHDTPLALYVFTSDLSKTNKQRDYILSCIRAGGVCINDSIMQVGLANAPFGGIGTSGQGSYHGIHSFHSFTHERTVLSQPFNNDSMLASRYPPFKSQKDKILRNFMLPFNDKVWFGRTGDVDLKGPGRIWSAYQTVSGLLSLAAAFVAGRKA